MMVPMLTLMIINKMVTIIITIAVDQASAKSKGEGVGERGTHSGQDLDSQVI